MKTARLLTTAAFAVLLAAPFAAHAQQTAPMPSPDATAPADPQAAPATPAAPADQQAMPASPTAPAAADAASPVAAVAQDPSAPLGSNTNPIPQNSPTPPGQAAALTPGDPSVVSNGPVPDTKANRAKYGKPLSAAGRATQPAGN
jgi:hypothetical protein